jgi:hypothetical protein
VQLSGVLNIGTSEGTGDITVGPGAVVNASVVDLRGQEVLEGGVIDPTAQLIGQGQTAGGYGTISAGDIIDEGVIQAGGDQASQRLLLVQGNVPGGGTLTINGTVQPSKPTGVLQINAGGTLELTGAVLNAATTTFTDNLTPADTYTVDNNVMDINFADAAGVLKLDDIAGFAGTISADVAGDSFVITGGTLSGLIVSNSNTLTFSDSGAGAGGVDKIIFASPVSASGFNIVNNDTVQVVPCFAEGTRIETETGPVAVEVLRVGDRVVTAAEDQVAGSETTLQSIKAAAINRRMAPKVRRGLAGDAATPDNIEPLTARHATTKDGEYELIVWIGRREVNCDRHPNPKTVWPVRVRAGAFGAGQPVRDLLLSPDHAVFTDSVLVPIKLLVNGTTIVQMPTGHVTYFHVELPRHAVILAEGLPVESYLDLGDRDAGDRDAGDRANFRGRNGLIRLFPDFAARLAPETALVWETRGAAPLVLTGEKLAAARRKVAGQTMPRVPRTRPKIGVPRQRSPAKA